MIGTERRFYNEIFELRMKEKKNTLEGRMNILTYEWGNAVQRIYYSIRFPDDKEIYLKDAKLKLGEVLTMFQMLCQELGFDFEEVREQGLEHTKERYEDFEINKWSETDKK